MSDMIFNEWAASSNEIAWFDRIFSAGQVTPAQVVRIRRIFPLGLSSRDDADAFFRIERSIVSRCPEWAALFREMLTDYVVWGERPTGVISADQATWLLHQLSLTKTDNAMALGYAIAEEAHDAPSWFTSAIAVRMSNVQRAA